MQITNNITILEAALENLHLTLKTLDNNLTARLPNDMEIQISLDRYT